MSEDKELDLDEMPLTIKEVQARSHQLSQEKGWWDGTPVQPLRPHRMQVSVELQLAKLALIHSEVSEAVEEARDGRVALWYTEAGKPEGVAAELADVVIRVGDLCEALGIDLETAIEVKHAYNKTRTHRHGGKLA